MKELQSSQAPVSTIAGATNRLAARTTPEQFCFWLKGVLAAGYSSSPVSLGPDTTALIKERLDSVFTHAAHNIPAGQCQNPGNCLQALCDNPNCKPRSIISGSDRLEIMC